MTHNRCTRARWRQAREPRQTLCQMGGQRPHPGRGVFSPLCGCLAPASRLADGGARHGWQRCGPRVHSADDPCCLSRPSPPAGVAGAPRQREGTFPKSSISPWSNSSAGCSPRGRRWCCWAMGHSMAPGSSTPCSRQAGPTRVAQLRAP